MTRGNLRHHLEEFYGEASPTPETMERLALLARADATGIAPQTKQAGSTWWAPQVVGIAAVLALLLSAASFYLVTSNAGSTTQLASLPQEGSAWPTGKPKIPVTPASDVPNLVAVKFEIAGCPNSAKVEPVFCELVDSFADKPILFARYDMSNRTNLQLSANWASGLGIEWACQGASQSGTILLIDRNSCEVVAKLTDRQELPKLKEQLDKMVQ